MVSALINVRLTYVFIIGGGGGLVWVRTRGYILGWYDWNPPMLPCGGNEPDDRQRLAWNFMHWERFRAYIKLARSFVIVNLYIYGCKYVIRRCVLSISLWLGCALWHIDQSTRGRDRRKVRWEGGTGGVGLKWPRPWLWTSARHDGESLAHIQHPW